MARNGNRCPIGMMAAVVVGLAGIAGAWVAPAADADSGLTLKRIMLSTGGVGYYEYQAAVTGEATLEMPIRLDRIDDVLKSIVVYDDQGTLGTIALPGREPLTEVFRTLPFGPDELKSPAALLEALRGAEVRIDKPTERHGRVLAVTEETATRQDGNTITRHRLTVAGDKGLQQIILEDAETITFADPRLQEQVSGALAALARHGERNHRRLAITSHGTGKRTVRVAYVAEAPLWKTAYRLTLDGTGTGGASDTQANGARLQGWAVVENLTGEAWRDVELTVAAGNPVTFRQALYDAYYVDRPQVPVEVLGRVMVPPGADEGTIPVKPAAAPRTRGLALSAGGGGAAKRMPAAEAGEMDDEDSALKEAMAPSPPAGMAAQMAAPAPEAPDLARTTAAESSEAATQVLFRFPDPVTVETGNSLLLPVVDRRVRSERIALYQPAVHERHPLAAVRLVNDAGTGLPPGLLTLYQRAADGRVAFVGDARLAPLPAGESRLLSFAVDQAISIDRTREEARPLTTATAADGLLRLAITERSTTTYIIANAADEVRTLVIEHPRRQGWDLTSPAADRVEATASAWRLKIDLPARETTSLAVISERPVYHQYSLDELESERLLALIDGVSLSADGRRALEELARLQSTFARHQRALQRLEKEGTDITREQERVRKNLAAVPRDSDLYRRYLDQLGSQEDRLAELGRQRMDTSAAAEQARDAVRAFLGTLRL